jgi:hypothetical protein
MDQEPAATVRALARLAAITVPEEREEALAAGFEGTRRIAEALAGRDYGEAEPAARFRPRAGRSE